MARVEVFVHDGTWSSTHGSTDALSDADDRRVGLCVADEGWSGGGWWGLELGMGVRIGVWGLGFGV